MPTKSMILEFAVRLHSVNSNWVTFFREVLGPEGIIYKTFPDLESRRAFEETQEYFEILKMLDDLVEEGIRDTNEPVREITLRVPRSVHAYLQLRAKDDGFGTLSRFAIRKLLKGCFDAQNIQPSWFEETCPGGKIDWELCKENCDNPDCPRKKKEDGTNENQDSRMVGNSSTESSGRNSITAVRQDGNNPTISLEPITHEGPGVS